MTDFEIYLPAGESGATFEARKATAEPVKGKRGVYALQVGVIDPREGERDYGDGVITRRVIISPGGDFRDTRFAAVIAKLHEREGLQDPKHEVWEQVRDLAVTGGQATVLRSGEGALGQQVSTIEEGRVGEDYEGRVWFKQKGAKTHGFYLKPGGVQAVESGWNAPAMLAKVREAEAEVPHVQALTKEDLLCAVGGDYNKGTRLNILYTHPGFVGGPGPVPGCRYEVQNYDPENDIVEGYLHVPDGSQLVSEHGSIYGQDLLRRHAAVALDEESLEARLTNDPDRLAELGGASTNYDTLREVSRNAATPKETTDALLGSVYELSAAVALNEGVDYETKARIATTPTMAGWSVAAREVAQHPGVEPAVLRTIESQILTPLDEFDWDHPGRGSSLHDLITEKARELTVRDEVERDVG